MCSAMMFLMSLLLPILPEKDWGHVLLVQGVLGFITAVGLFARGESFIGGIVSGVTGYVLWRWWSDDFTRRRRRKLKDRLKRRVRLSATGRVGVSEA